MVEFVADGPSPVGEHRGTSVQRGADCRFLEKSPGFLRPPLRSHLTPLTAALALASLAFTNAHASVASLFADKSARHMATAGAYAAADIYVQNCNDSGTGSLRQTVLEAQDGDSVDLRALNCSKITLASPSMGSGGEIIVPQNKLYILGSSQSNLTISANNQSRVFNHTGTGKLTLWDGLTISDGQYSSSIANGGCIRSAGSVTLIGSKVTTCLAHGNQGARGGGVYAAGQIELFNSTVSTSEASADSGGFAYGGGLYSKDGFGSFFSTIENNKAYAAGSSNYALGGGAAVVNNPGIYAEVKNTLVSGNEAEGGYAYAGGIFAGSTTPISIVNSTIANNIAHSPIQHSSAGGILAGNTLNLANSTVVGNFAYAGGAGVHAASFTTIYSSIVALNSGPPGTLDVFVGGAIEGGGNDIIFSNKPPLPTDLAVDPKLGPLQHNGGPTQTMLPLSGSPVIGQGNNQQGDKFDQRGQGYPRVSGTSVDIGAIQYDTIFSDEFEP